MYKLLTRFVVIVFLQVTIVTQQVLAQADTASAAKQTGDGGLFDLLTSTDMAVGMISGLFSGLLVAATLVLLKLFYEDKIKPLLKPTESYDLTDTWIEQYIPLFEDEREPLQEQSCILEIQHTAGVITGTATFTDNEFGVRKMLITGKTVNIYVHLDLNIINNKRFGIVNYLLKVTKGGEELEGTTAYFHPGEDKVSCAKSTWYRKSNFEKLSRYKEVKERLKNVYPTVVENPSKPDDNPPSNNPDSNPPSGSPDSKPAA